MRVTFHVWKYTVTIVIRETHKNADRNEKTTATLASDGCFCGLATHYIAN